MINFNQRDEVVPSTLILLSIIIMSLTLIFMLAVPRPTSSSVTKGEKAPRQHMYNDISDAKKRGALTRQQIAPHLWTGTADSVSAAVLAQLTTESAARSLKLGAFRPQRGSVLAGITELPFNVQISGSYDSIRSLMARLDASGTRVVLRSVQIAASEEKSNEVTATLGLSAYMVTDPDILVQSKENGHA